MATTKKFTELTEDTAPTHDDLIAVANDPAGTPGSKKVKLSNLFAAMQTWLFGSDAGSTDTYAVTLSPAPSAYVTGQHYRFKANTANTGAATINFNSLGAKTIKKAAGGITTDLDTNDIRAGQWVDLVYDGTNMQMQSLLGNAPTGGSGGLGDVVGPSSATDNALVRFDTTTGKLIQDSAVTLDDTGAITVPEMAAPSTPAANKVALYAKSDGLFYSKDDAGTETLVSGGAGGGSIAPLTIDSANVVSQRNALNAQTFNIFKSDDGSGNSTFLTFHDSSGVWEIKTDKAGSGSIQNIRLSIGTNKYEFSSSSLLPPVNQGQDLGASGTRWALAYVAQLDVKSDDVMRWNSSTKLSAPTDGMVQIKANSGATAKLAFNDSGSTAPMLKGGANPYLEARLADDSAYTGFRASYLLSNAVTFANRPGTPVEGMICAFTDSTTATWGATITGTGSNHVLGYYNGTNWTVAAA